MGNNSNKGDSFPRKESTESEPGFKSRFRNLYRPNAIFAWGPNLRHLLQEINNEEFVKKGRVLSSDKQAIGSLVIRRPKLLKTVDLNSNLKRAHVLKRRSCSIQILKPVKKLRNIFYEGDDFSEASFRKLVTSSRLTQHVKKLHLNFSSNQKISILSNNIQFFKALKELSLESHESLGPKDKSILLVLSKLKACRELRTVKLKVSDIEKNSPQDFIENIFKSLSGVRALTDLHLDFGSLTEKKSCYFSGICKGILKLKPLSVLSLNLKSWNDFMDSDLDLLCSSLLRHSTLTKLDLNFTDCRKLTDKKLESLGLALKELLHLRSLTLDFSECFRITPLGIKSLLRELQTLHRISKLDFSFRENKFFHGRFFQDELASFQLLISLRLDFQCRSLHGRTLSEGLRKLTNLKDLILHFGRHTPEAHLIQDLCDPIKQLTNLKTLHLFFDRNKDMGDQTLVALSSAISFLKKLDSLNLCYSKDHGDGLNPCGDITNEGIEELSLALQKMNSLRVFALHLRDVQSMNDDSVQMISQALSKIGLLSEVTLNFRNCRNVTTSGMMALADAIQNLNSLKIVTLDFSEGEDIEKEGLFRVVQTLKTIPLLKMVNLYFACCSDPTNREYVEKELWRVPELVLSHDSDKVQ